MTGRSELKARARTNLLGRYGTAVGAVILGQLAGGAILTCFIWSGLAYAGLLIRLLSAAIVLLLLMLLKAGFARLYLSFMQQRKAAATDIFYAFTHHPDSLLTALICEGLLCIPAVAAGIAILYLSADRSGSYTASGVYSASVSYAALLGTAAVTLCLVYLLMLPYRFVPWLFLQHSDWSGPELMRESRLLLHQRKARLVGLDLSFAGWYGLCLLSFGIGSWWVRPYHGSCIALFYLDAVSSGTPEDGESI